MWLCYQIKMYVCKKLKQKNKLKTYRYIYWFKTLYSEKLNLKLIQMEPDSIRIWELYSFYFM